MYLIERIFTREHRPSPGAARYCDGRGGCCERRGTRNRRPDTTAAGLQVLELHYVDSIGFVAALVFRAFIGAELNRTMVKLYDRFCFPLSITADKALSNVIGKNVMVVAKKK